MAPRALISKFGHPDKYYATADAAARSVLRLALGVAIARLTSPEIFAAYVVLMAIEVVATSLWQALFTAPLLTGATGLPPEDRDALWRRAVLRQPGWLFVLFAGVGAAALVFVDGLTLILGTGFGLAVVLAAAASVLRACLQSRFLSGASLVATGVVGVSVVLGLALAWRMNWDAHAAAWWSVAAGNALSLPILWTRVPAPAASESARALDDGRTRYLAREILSGTIAYSACSRTQAFVLTSVSATAQTAAFGVATTTIGPVRMLSQLLSGLVRPRVALHFGRGAAPRARRVLVLSTLSTLGAGVALVLLLAIAGRPLVGLVFGDAYALDPLVLPLAAAFGTLEGVGTLLMLGAQSGLERGATSVTRTRWVLSIVSVALVVPACVWAGATGAFALMAAIEGVFVIVMVRLLAGVDYAASTIADPASSPAPRAA